MNKISIIGLGWLGLPLAKNLQEKGYEVIGSTTTGEKVKKLEAEGISSVQFSLEPYPKGLGFQKLFEAEILVLTIPPRSRTQSGEQYLEELKFLKSMLKNSSVKKLVFVSSTGIYPEKNQAEKYTEESELDPSITGNKTLWKAEQLMSQDKSYELTVVRFGGLMGEERVPGKYFAGKENVEGHSRVNYIHQDDAVGIITWIIEKNLWNETFNGVAPIHPLKREVIEKSAQDAGLAPPKSFQSSTEGENRLISSEKIIQKGYSFTYANPLDFSYNLKK